MMIRRTTGLLLCVGIAACGGSPSAGGSGGATGTGTGGSNSGGGGTNDNGGNGGGAPGGASALASFEPMKAGAKWNYATEDMSSTGAVVSGTKAVTVEVSEPVPGRTGVSAWRIHTVVPGSEDQLTWQEETATAIVRYRDDVYAAGGTTMRQSFSTYAPRKLRLDISAAHLMEGQTYTETFTETLTDVTANTTSSSAKSARWLLVSASEPVTVPAGAFSAVHVRKSNAVDGTVSKDYWFVRGVGKVKETSAAGRTESLMSYSIP